MLLGIGYLPRLTGPDLWQEFDPVEIEDDLTHIATLGFQAVRVPLFWKDFQPSADQIGRQAFDRFGHFLEIAHACNLQVRAGLWSGIWDGALWWPDWGVSAAPLPPHWPLVVNGSWARWGRVRHPFSDERMLAAQPLLIDELVHYFSAHPALLGWEPLPGFGRLAAAVLPQTVLTWLQRTNELLLAAAPTTSITYLLALDALETATPVWPDDVIQRHGDPSLSLATFASDRRRLPLSLRWVAFALDVASGLAKRPVTLHVAGLPTAPPGERSQALDGVYYAEEEEAAAHLAQIAAIADSRHCAELWLWRWADIPEQHWHTPPYDRPNWRRHTGLLRADGSEKALVNALKPQEATQDYPVLEFDPDTYRGDPPLHFSRLWQEYQQAVPPR